MPPRLLLPPFSISTHTRSSSQPRTDLWSAVGVTPNIFMLKQGSCAEKIGGRRGGKLLSSSSLLFCDSLLGPFISETKSPNSSKSGVGWISYPYDAKYTSYANGRGVKLPNHGPLQPPLFPFPTFLLFLSCTPPILCSLLLKFCV